LRKLLSYALILLLLLNVWGYYGVFVGFQYNHEQRINRALDDHKFSTDETVALKIPLALPYATDMLDFERVNGQFEHEGELYRLVDKKLSNDTLTLVCLRDSKHGEIKDAQTRFVKTFADNSSDASSHQKTFMLIKDYLGTAIQIENTNSGWQIDVRYFGSFPSKYVASCDDLLRPPQG
jgi:hypothetical protein